MKTNTLAAVVLLLAPLTCVAELPVHPWDIETTTTRAVQREIVRGESIHLQPRYLNGGTPMDLTDVYEVAIRYRSTDMATNAYYIAYGSVQDATAGVVRITWTPTNEPPASVCQYTITAASTNGLLMRGFGTLRFIGSIQGDPTNMVPAVAATFDWSLITEHLNTEAAPFVGPGDMLAVNQRIDGHDAAISNVTELVGTGVAGVESNLLEHVVEAAATNAAQDELIEIALQSANMGGDIEGVSTQAVVVAIQGRDLPPAEDQPENNEAMIWDSSLMRWVHRLVDLSPIQAAISNLQATAASRVYVDTEISEVRGLVDGNDHTHMLTESFAAADWLEIATGVFQHNAGWMAYNATMIDGQITLAADEGYMAMAAGITQCVSRIVVTPSSGIWSAYHAETAAGPWTGYDSTRDNIVSTNEFAVRFVNTSGTGLTISQVDLYTWTFPERVAYSRDFAGLHLLVDTPPGDQLREAVNVQYVRTLAASNDVSGSFATGFSVDRIKGGSINATARATGFGPIWYSTVNEHRYVDLATQFELDAAVGLLCTVASYNALQARVAATEAGSSVPLGGDLSGTAITGTVQRIRGVAIDQPAANQTTPVFDLAQNKIVWLSVLSSNLVYSAGTNDIANVPASSAAFYRALDGTNAIMPIVLDHVIVGWFGADGLTLPYGTLNLLESNLTANVRLYDGTGSLPALSTVSDPDTGWHRSAEDVWRFVAAGNVIADFGVGGIALGTGKDVILKDGYRAASVDEIDNLAFTETDPLAVQHSATVVAWTNAGGSYTNEGVIATSTLSSNGFAAVTYDLAADAGMAVAVDMSDANGTEWETFAPFATPGYVRVSLAETLPSPSGVLDTSISNIAATVWTRPDLYSTVTDTAGQILHVDTAEQPRQPVPLAQMQAAVAAVTPSTWSQHAATQDVNLDGNMLLMGNGWSVSDVDGLGVISYTDLAVSSNSLQIAANLVPAITATAGYSGLTIATLSVDGGTGTVGVATNGVTTTPILQWTASLTSINWQNLTPISETYPSTNAAGHYEIVVDLPSASAGFMRAVQPDGTSRVDIGMPLYVQGNLIETGFIRSGTNLLWVLDGVTNRVLMEVWP